MKIHSSTPRFSLKPRINAAVKRGLDQFGQKLFPAPERPADFQLAPVGGPPLGIGNTCMMEAPPISSGGRTFNHATLKDDLLKYYREKSPDHDVQGLAAAFRLRENQGQDLTAKAEGIELLVSWDVSPNTVAAFILGGIEPDKVREFVGDSVAELITRKNILAKFSFDPSAGIKQGSKFIKMLILREGSLDIILLRIAEVFESLAKRNAANHALAAQALFAFAPFLAVIGYHSHASQLEDWAFLNIDPNQFQATVSNTFNDFKVSQAFLIDELRTLGEFLDEDLETPHRIGWRPKGIYSIWNKTRAVDDLFGIRLVVPTQGDCYLMLTEIISQMDEFGFDYLPEKKDDYIVKPSTTGYQALHITFREKHHGWMVEIQIKSEKMDYEAEVGRCSHLRYKLGQSGFDDFLFEAASAEEKFQINRQIFQRQGLGFAYDPKGVLHKVGPVSVAGKRVTVLDFAFYVGHKTGSRCLGGVIRRLDQNGKLKVIQANYATPIENGDQIALRLSEAPESISPKRLAAATTELALASQELLRRGLNISNLKDNDQTRKEGEAAFTKTVADWQKVVTAAFRRLAGRKVPDLSVLFSLDRVINKKGLRDLGTFYTAVGLKGERQRAFLLECRKIIETATTVVGYNRNDIKKGEADLFFLIADRPGVILRLLAALRMFNFQPENFSVVSREHDYILLKIRAKNITLDKFDGFSSKLQNLYHNLQPALPLRSHVRLRTNIHPDQLADFLELLVGIGGSIQNGAVAKSFLRKTLSVDLQVAFPLNHFVDVEKRVVKAAKGIFGRIKLNEV